MLIQLTENAMQSLPAADIGARTDLIDGCAPRVDDPTG